MIIIHYIIQLSLSDLHIIMHRHVYKILLYVRHYIRATLFYYVFSDFAKQCHFVYIILFKSKLINKLHFVRSREFYRFYAMRLLYNIYIYILFLFETVTYNQTLERLVF